MKAMMLFAAAALALTGVASGCAHEQAIPPATVVSSQQFTPPPSACPMNIPGAKVSTEDTDDGIALNFTTSQQSVFEVRQRVLEMAKYYNQQNPSATSAPSAARVIYTKDGAKMVISPVNPIDLAALRAQTQSRAQYMASTGTCTAM